MIKYQHDYAASRPQMYESKSRKEKAERIVKLLGYFYGKSRLIKLTLLDVGGAHLPFDDLEWEAVCESHELDDDHELHEALRARGLQVVRSDVDLPLVTLEDLLSATFVGL
jgi:hypothetical protein